MKINFILVVTFLLVPFTTFASILYVNSIFSEIDPSKKGFECTSMTSDRPSYDESAKWIIRNMFLEAVEIDINPDMTEAELSYENDRLVGSLMVMTSGPDRPVNVIEAILSEKVLMSSENSEAVTLETLYHVYCVKKTSLDEITSQSIFENKEPLNYEQELLESQVLR